MRCDHPAYGFLRPPPALWLAIMLLSGIVLAEQLQWAAWGWLLGGGVSCLTALLLQRTSCQGVGMLAVTCGGLCLGGTIWSVRFLTDDPGSLLRVLNSPQETVRLAGTVISIPSAKSRQELAYRTPDGQAPIQTQFLLQAAEIQVDDQPVPVNGRLRVQVDGDVTEKVCWGDQLKITGRVECEFPATNPGEFDFQAFLRRQSIQGVLYVRHGEALAVQPGRPAWQTGVLRFSLKALQAGISRLRQQAEWLIRTHLGGEIRPLASALLLGNRGHLDPMVEREFIASGTMHLLSISGLHVGILFLFLRHGLNGLLVRHRWSLIISLIVCMSYALLTDLRPSVVRSTGFILFMVVGQLLNRELRLATLTGNTAVVMLLWDPGVAFDPGAWLSFLAVLALAWVADRRLPDTDRPVPADAMELRERLRGLLIAVTSRGAMRYRQMLAIAVFSLPLVASQFHVVSISGLIINILLIPLTGLAMICGFLFLGFGLLLPVLAAAAGACFSLLLNVLNSIVAWTASLKVGSITIPDVPFWFLITYYVLLLVAVTQLNVSIRRVTWSLLSVLVLAGFWRINQPVAVNELRCTILNVGHGNAVVVEMPEDRVLLFDAGALNRGPRTADLVSRFLWHRGWRMIDAVVVSHADIDHYNAVRGLAERMPIGQLLTTREFTVSAKVPVQELLDVLGRRRIHIIQVLDRDGIGRSADGGGPVIQFLQAVPSPAEQLDDNELSLVAVVEFAGRSIAIPGDLEKRGQRHLLDRLSAVDVLISPHHGSRVSNTADTAQAFSPQTVIASARSAVNNAYLKQVYGAANLLNTSQDGAVTVTVSNDGRLNVTDFGAGMYIFQGFN